MRLWLKDITAEYAMTKPPEEEIWPNARETKKRAYQHTIFTEFAAIQVDVDEEDYGEKEYDAENIETKYVRWSRTHCPRCWQKYEQCVYLGVEMGGHKSFHCPADNDWDDRFPREG